ncbi:MAG TPA: hypothetical protein DCM28_24140 [Phycisphaerales bacterium]|nr:hypothetical protein [Phycisphaerales bacterium]HCD34550.1 hypothetical protein [Phycisphaerales bacterium]|tara:strand:+ start:5455 stop:6609 length:1155 start_codon:yes stop_codon:yes gene_type:complete
MQSAFKERLNRSNPVWMNFGPDEGAVDVVESFGHYEAEYAAIRKGVGILHMPWCGIVNIGGSDRLSFLNNMVTHDTVNLTAGQTRRCFLLNKQGRIDTDMMICQKEGNCLLLMDRYATSYVARELERYVFTEDVDTADITDQWEVLGLFGPMAMRVLESAGGFVELIDLPAGQFKSIELDGQPCMVIRQDMGSTLGLLVLVKTDALDTFYNLLTEQVGGIVPDIDQSGEANPTSPKRSLVGRAIGWSAYNTARIESGVPLFRVDYGPDCLPHETSILEQTVSFTKGCYLGQEVVARMESRGHPKRKLVGIKFASTDLPIAGSQIQDDDGNVIGGITSSTQSPLSGMNAVGFAMMKWGKHRKGTKIKVGAEGKLIDGEVSDLKLV